LGAPAWATAIDPKKASMAIAASLRIEPSNAVLIDVGETIETSFSSGLLNSSPTSDA
jgi:hypothetical protein